ncbi:MAG: KEOPS complex kinase/ATPase Bud32 [Candidatus Micrarchaeaceae archaeon]
MIKKISEGAEATIYEVRAQNCSLILKYRPAKGYRVKNLDNMLRARRTRVEARALGAAHNIGVNVPLLRLVSKYGILTSMVKGSMLKDMLNRNSKLLNKTLREAGRHLAALHSAGIVHGDYTPANIMVDGETVYVIDFGLASFTNSIEDKALDLLLMKRSLSSAHFNSFMEGYKALSNQSEVCRRLAEIERRGRYQTRTLIAKS